MQPNTNCNPDKEKKKHNFTACQFCLFYTSFFLQFFVQSRFNGIFCILGPHLNIFLLGLLTLPACSLKSPFSPISNPSKTAGDFAFFEPQKLWVQNCVSCLVTLPPCRPLIFHPNLESLQLLLDLALNLSLLPCQIMILVGGQGCQIAGGWSRQKSQPRFRVTRWQELILHRLFLWEIYGLFLALKHGNFWARRRCQEKNLLEEMSLKRTADAKNSQSFFCDLCLWDAKSWEIPQTTFCNTSCAEIFCEEGAKKCCHWQNWLIAKSFKWYKSIDIQGPGIQNTRWTYTYTLFNVRAL